jgi:hypothetical protein
MAGIGEPERIEIPLVMLRGNMDILLSHKLPVKAISLEWSEEYVNAVVLVVHGADQEVAKELGFQTKKQGQR